MKKYLLFILILITPLFSFEIDPCDYFNKADRYKSKKLQTEYKELYQDCKIQDFRNIKTTKEIHSFLYSEPLLKSTRIEMFIIQNLHKYPNLEPYFINTLKRQIMLKQEVSKTNKYKYLKKIY